jgi:hypothetical protein
MANNRKIAAQHKKALKIMLETLEVASKQNGREFYNMTELKPAFARNVVITTRRELFAKT